MRSKMIWNPEKIHLLCSTSYILDGASGTEPTCQCRRCKRCGFNPWVGKMPGEGNGNPVQYSCLENFKDRGVWWATVHGTAKSRTQLNTELLG